VRFVGLALVLAAVVSIGLGLAHPYGDPRVVPAKGRDTLLQGALMPAAAKKILITKCADCHSNETHWPVYSRVAPGSWLIERDIVAARRKMNLSSWERLPADEQDVLIGQIIHEVKSGSMPPLQYQALHWYSKVSPDEVALLSSMKKAAQVETSDGGVGDATRGKLVFEKRCTGCHALEADREGPRLGGVFGRKAGGVAGFTYSAGLKRSGITWDAATLERWLADPELVVPDTTMDFRVPKIGERSDLVAYLKSR
jgi:cytochrome c